MTATRDAPGAAPAGVDLRLVLVRHGETEALAQGGCVGTCDPPLAVRGRAQMEWVARHLHKQPAAALYASPRQRAMASARVIANNGRALPITVDARLGEIDFGLLEGLSYDDVAARYPDVWRTWMTTPTDVTFPGGESFAAFSARVDDVIRDLRRREHGRVVILVAHGGVNRVVLARALGLDFQHLFRLQQSCGGISVIDFYERTSIVQAMNVTDREG